MHVPASFPPPAAALVLALALVSGTALAQQPAAPETGRWITESGNLEVEIAPCGQAYCGTVTRVIAGNAMAGSGAASPVASPAVAPAVSPLGKTILTDLQPQAEGGWQGHIFNRENGKTYHSRLAALGADRLELTIYENTPGDGRVQVWRRAP